RAIQGCRMLSFAASYARSDLSTRGERLATAPPNLSEDQLKQGLAVLLTGEGAAARRSEFDLVAVSEAIHALVVGAGRELDLPLPRNARGGLRPEVNEVLAPVVKIVLERPDLIARHLPFLVDAGRLDDWSTLSGTALTAAILRPGVDLSSGTLANLDA